MDDFLESDETYMAMQLSYQPSIDGLRALAVLAVVLYHADVLGMRAGYLGVDIFFVISGFLISRIIIAEFVASRFTLVGFYERRVRRIIPALLVMVATTIAVDWYVLMPLDYKRLVQSAAATGLFASNIFFWRQQQGGYFNPASAEQPLLHTWPSRGRLHLSARRDDYPVSDFVKMDIEGAEVSALEGAGQILSAQRTIWLVAFHGVSAKLGVIKLLANSGLAIEWIRYAELLARPAKDVVPGEFIE